MCDSLALSPYFSVTRYFRFRLVLIKAKIGAWKARHTAVRHPSEELYLQKCFGHVGI